MSNIDNINESGEMQDQDILFDDDFEIDLEDGGYFDDSAESDSDSDSEDTSSEIDIEDDSDETIELGEEPIEIEDDDDIEIEDNGIEDDTVEIEDDTVEIEDDDEAFSGFDDEFSSLGDLEDATSSDDESEVNSEDTVSTPVIPDYSEEDLDNMSNEQLLELLKMTEGLPAMPVEVEDTEESENNDTTDDAEGSEESEDSNVSEEESIEELPEDTDSFEETPDEDDSLSVRKNSIDADDGGAVLHSDELLNDDLELVDDDTNTFINNKGELVVMDTSGDIGDNFKFMYIDIEKIGYTKRIRQVNTNVEDLVHSIKSTGLLEPLVVAPTQTAGVYALLAGFRRIMACAKAGIRKIPCVVNMKVNTMEIPLLEALYNHSRSYTIREIIDCIDYLEKQKGIMSASMIEYILQLNSGEYTKLKDILNDNDDDIVSKLYDGTYTIETAFKKLEQRRRKESADEKENKKAARVYEDTVESGADTIADSGEKTDESDVLSEDEIKSLAFNAADLASVDDEEFEEIKEDGNIDGFEPNKQDYKDRERLDPALRKAVLARDKNTCQTCGLSGQEYLEVFDVHHIVEVFLGGSDAIDNLVTVCTCCHKLIHLYARGDLHVRAESELSEAENIKFKRIMKLGNVIRKGMVAKGMKREELKKVDKAETIGRTKPGTEQVAG